MCITQTCWHTQKIKHWFSELKFQVQASVKWYTWGFPNQICNEIPQCMYRLITLCKSGKAQMDSGFTFLRFGLQIWHNGMELTSFDFHALVKMLQNMSVHKKGFYSCTLTLLTLFCNDFVVYGESDLCLSQQFYFFFSNTDDSFPNCKNWRVWHIWNISSSLMVCNCFSLHGL